MKKYLVPTILLLVYIALLIKVMVFKDLPVIRVGQLMLNFGGTDAGNPANFVPFRTILPYLLGYKGWIIASINLIGNIALLVPVGFLAAWIYRDMTWKKALILAVMSGLTIECLQQVLHVGIFDIDDVILNAFGVMIGYWAFKILIKWISEKKYKYIIMSALLIIIAAAGGVYFVYPRNQPVINPGPRGSNNSTDAEGPVPQTGDLCGGTGGIGQVVSVQNNNSFTIKRKDGSNLTVNLSSQGTVKTSSGPIALSNLVPTDRVTLVGGPNPDGSFTADAVFVCNK